MTLESLTHLTSLSCMLCLALFFLCPIRQLLLHHYTTLSFLSHISTIPNIPIFLVPNSSLIHAFKKLSSKIPQIHRENNSWNIRGTGPEFILLYHLLSCDQQQELYHLPKMGETCTCGQICPVPSWLLTARTGCRADCFPADNLQEMYQKMTRMIKKYGTTSVQ